MPMLETPRLLLRELILDDAGLALRLGSDPQVMRYVGEGFTTLEEARALLLHGPLADYQKHGYGRWACVLKSTGEAIGFSGLKYLDELAAADIGYRFLPAYWGQGFATEAGRAVLDFGFTQLQLPRILGLVVPENTASVHVLQKLGLTYVEMIENRGMWVAKYEITGRENGAAV